MCITALSSRSLFLGLESLLGNLGIVFVCLCWSSDADATAPPHELSIHASRNRENGTACHIHVDNAYLMMKLDVTPT